MSQITELRDLVFAAHDKAARRANTSTQVICAAFDSNGGQLLPAIVAGLMTLGGRHGPIVQAYEVLQNGPGDDPIPGWGNSFVKGKPDPIWEEVDSMLVDHYANMWMLIQNITNSLHERGKVVYPNAACYTAAYAIIARIDANMAPGVFLASRLGAWYSMLES